jgi:hypothetical protein
MRHPIIYFVLIAFLILACERKLPAPQGKSEPSPKVIVEKEKEEREHPIPPEVKIKLKRDGKNNYSWELSGSDVDQIIRVDDKLKKKLGGDLSK